MASKEAKRRLDELLMQVHRYRQAITEFQRAGKPGLVTNEHGLRIAYAQVRAHCAEHGLDLPIDIPASD